MRCTECKTENRKGAVFCAHCGAKLPKAKSAVRSAGRELKLRSIILFAAGLVLLFCAVTVALCFTKCGDTPESYDQHSMATVTPEPTPRPTHKLTPLDQIKPTPRPTPTPVPTPRPTHKLTPLDQIKPHHKPTEAPAETPGADQGAEKGEDCAPIDALCDYIINGGAENVRAALPPEYIDYTISNYGFASSLLGGDDAVIEYASKVLLSGIKKKYGEISSIDYTLVNRRVLTEAELAELCAGLGEVGMTTMPTEAHLLTVDMVIISSKGTFTERLMPNVLLIDGAWYIDPRDLSF